MEKHSQNGIGVAVAKLAAAISMVSHAVMKDGTIAAAFRQGADEVGMALKAFPESIQAQEAGTILSPTQGEIAASREPRGMASAPQRDLPSAGDIARRGKGGVHGQPEVSEDRLRTAGEIARGTPDPAHAAGQDYSMSRERDHDHGRGL